MKLIAKRVIKWGVPVLLVLLIAVYGYISFMITSGLTNWDRQQQADEPGNYALQYEEVEFTSRGDAITLDGWYLPGDNEKPTIIFVHGIGGMRSGDNATEIAYHLVDQGFNVLLFDLRAHGSSGGDYVSGGYFEQQDVLGAIDFLVKRGVTTDDIGVIGFSMGAGTSILALVEEPGIRALVVDSPYARASDLLTNETALKTGIPKWLSSIFIPTAKAMASLFYGIDIGALVPEEAVRQLTYPILVIHGEEDTRIPYTHGERVYGEAYQGSTIWLVPGVDHADAFLDYPEEYILRVTEYFIGQLGID
jgi:pimeloyl-ACP methyl ester carboxylesterase